jgi:hypothetical protein
MTCGIGIDILTVELCGTQRQYSRACGCWVFDHDVEVELLGHCRIWPSRRLVTGGTLECQARGCVAGGDHNPVVVAVCHR